MYFNTCYQSFISCYHHKLVVKYYFTKSGNLENIAMISILINTVLNLVGHI